MKFNNSDNFEISVFLILGVDCIYIGQNNSEHAIKNTTYTDMSFETLCNSMQKKNIRFTLDECQLF